MSIITYNFVVKVVRKKILISFSYNRFFNTYINLRFYVRKFFSGFFRQNYEENNHETFLLGRLRDKLWIVSNKFTCVKILFSVFSLPHILYCNIKSPEWHFITTAQTFHSNFLCFHQ